MRDEDWLAERFEQDRGRLRAVAYRMLGSQAEAEDAVQEAWLRLSRTDVSDVANLSGWLTTVVGRICLDLLRSRSTRPEEPWDGTEAVATAPAGDADPEREAVLADSLGIALLVVLDTLTPSERLAFVLHDLFAVPFDEVAQVLGKTPDAARQLASRARRRIQGSTPAGETDPARRREVVDAFLAAARGGDFAALLTVLDPDVVMHADATAGKYGGTSEIRTAESVAAYFSGKATEAQPAFIEGIVGVVWAPGGKPRVALRMTILGGRILAIDAVADPDALDSLDLVLLPSS